MNRLSFLTRLLRYGQWIVPKSRWSLHWKELLPLLIVMAVIGSVLIGLQVSGRVMYAAPWQFLWLLLSVWIWWIWRNGWSGLNRTRAIMALTCRLLLLAVLVTAMAEPRSVRTNNALAVVYALDLSESVGQGAREQASEFIARAVSEKLPADSVGLVTFGKNSAVEVPARPSFPLEGGQIIFNTRISPDETNLAQALSLSAALLPEDARGRIVLISDGNETTGNLKPVLNDLKSRGIAVDVMPITYTYDKEVWIERLELPQTVKLGETYEASVIVSSLKAGKGKLLLTENGQPLSEPQPIEFKDGRNRFDIPLQLREAGFYEYQATLIVDEKEDHLSANNKAIGHIFVEGEGRILLVTDPEGSRQDWQSLRRALLQGKQAVDVREAFEFPHDPLALMPYDCVIFCNVANDLIDPQQAQALHDAVYNQGLGFLMVGGKNSFGPGGYHRTLVEKILPVDMDITRKKVLPKGALVIILHTCEFPEGNVWAKLITRQAIKVLGAQDEVGVIDYEGGEKWVFKIQPVADYESMVRKINAADPGDMPSFTPTMEMGFRGLKASDASVKHMIIISDGDPTPPPPALVQAFKDNQITMSMVAIYPHGGQEITVMRTVAEATGGRYFFPDDPAKLPSIFIKEAKTLKRNMIRNEPIHLTSGYPSPVLKGLDSLPQLGGLVLASLKDSPLVENVLYTSSETDGETETDPVLAIWRYGMGTTAAFTSDLSPAWGKDWVTWDKYSSFVNQLMLRVARVRKAGHLRMWSYPSGGEGVVMVEDFSPEEGSLDITAGISGPGDQIKTFPMRQVGPRRYQLTFPTWGTGLYQVNVIGKGANEREDRNTGGFLVSYSPEYLRFTSNYQTLRDVVETTGGEELTPAASREELYGRREPKRSSQAVFDWLLYAMAFLIPLDVGLRRVQLDWQVIRNWFRPAKAEQHSTMGTLLKTKESVGSRLKSRSERGDVANPIPVSMGSRPLSGTSSSRPSSTRPVPPVAPPKATPQASPAALDGSTTSRLLDLKRRRQGGSDGTDSR